MRILRLLGPAAILLTVGCHSAYIDATLTNQTDKPITLVELDYPSASFGTQALKPQQSFHYRFKILGTGKLKFVYTDTANQEHTVNGPQLAEGDEGSLTVTLESSGVQWGSQLKGRKKDEFPITPN